MCACVGASVRVCACGCVRACVGSCGRECGSVRAWVYVEESVGVGVCVCACIWLCWPNVKETEARASCCLMLMRGAFSIGQRLERKG